MQKIRIFVATCCLLTATMISASSLWASSITVSDLGVDNAEGAVSVGFSIVVNDVAPLMNALREGGDYEVRCTSKLFNRRAGFWNSFLAEGEYTCLISSRPIARECIVQDRRGPHTIEFSELQAELNRFWSRLSIPLGERDMVQRGKAYRVEMNFKVTRTNISSWVSKPLFFVSWDLVPESIYQFDFDF